MSKSCIKFNPTTTSLSGRYSQTASITCEHRTIRPGLFSNSASPEPTYLPPQWSVHTHPEGNQYFVRNTCPKLVTDAYMLNPAVQRKVLEVAEIVDDTLASHKAALSDAVEFFMTLEDDDQTCAYYLVDHRLRVEFWLENVDTDDLDLPPSASEEHLRLALEELYWNHVEYFCCHESTGLDLSLNDLIDIMNQNRIDHLTSSTATYPYRASECTQFLQALESIRSSQYPVSAHSKWVIARAWGTIVSHRFVGHHGQEFARLCTTQTILDVQRPEETFIFKALDWLGFTTPGSYLRRLNAVWTDNVVDSIRWANFLTAALEDWRMSLCIAFGVLISNLLLVASPVKSSMAIAVPSIVLCNAAVGIAVMLLMKYGPVNDMIIPTTADMMSASLVERFGFQLIAVAFSLPRAFTLWALILSSLQLFTVLLGPTLTAICIAAAIAALLTLSGCKFLAKKLNELDISIISTVFTSLHIFRQKGPSLEQSQA